MLAVRLLWPGTIVHMEAVTALLGAVIGGFLVLVGDVFRRRAERRDRALRRAVDASASFAMVINQTCGEMIDAKFNQLQRPASALRAERHEAATCTRPGNASVVPRPGRSWSWTRQGQGVANGWGISPVSSDIEQQRACPECPTRPQLSSRLPSSDQRGVVDSSYFSDSISVAASRQAASSWFLKWLYQSPSRAAWRVKPGRAS